MEASEALFSRSISELAEDIKNQKVTVVEIVNGILQRIDAVDKHLNAFITINPKALELAEKADKEIAGGKYRGPLHGIPIGLKDIIDAKNIKTTMGSEIFKDNIPNEDATVVKQLNESGAIIIGKLNTHQIAYGPTGDRSYYGPVRNPYNLSKMTGGSSSGSGAAVAAFLSYGALGTDTSGSVRIPASFCGIVGMKPTYGTISKHGVNPLSWTLDHVGPMTRTIKDNAILMNVLQGDDKRDPDTITRKNEDYTRFIGKSIHEIKIGVPQQFYFDNANEEIKIAFNNTIAHLEELGAEINNVNLPNMEEFSDAQKTILRSEAYATHEKNIHDFPDLWDHEVKERLMTAIQDKGFEYASALRLRHLAKKAFNKASSNVDALITPAMSILPPNINERYLSDDKSDDNHIRWSIIKLTAPTNLNGFPSLTLPCSFSSDGMPIGIQLIGKELEEAKLYQIGYALEQKLSLNIGKINI